MGRPFHKKEGERERAKPTSTSSITQNWRQRGKLTPIGPTVSPRQRLPSSIRNLSTSTAPPQLRALPESSPSQGHISRLNRDPPWFECGRGAGDWTALADVTSPPGQVRRDDGRGDSTRAQSILASHSGLHCRY